MPSQKISHPSIDIAVCYHKKAPIFESDALKPMQLGKAVSDIDLGIRGDDTGDHISEKNRYYGTHTAIYWLWKNSDAEIKGMIHYRRLLDLSSAIDQTIQADRQRKKTAYDGLPRFLMIKSGKT